MTRFRTLLILVIAVSALAVSPKAARAQFCTGTTDDHVFYLDTSSHVAEVCQSLAGNGSWQLSLSGTGVTATGGSMTSFFAGGQEHVGYIGTDNHVYQLYLNGSTWVNQDLTAAAGAPNSGTVNLTGYVAGAVQSFIYIDTSGHVRQLFFNGSWHDSDLTALTGAPAPATSTLASYVANVQSVIYLSSDGHVRQMYNNGSWHTSDLTALTGAPTALLKWVFEFFHTDTPLAAFQLADNTGSQHVYYVANGPVNGQFSLHELRFTGSWGDAGSVNQLSMLKGSRLAGFGQGSGLSAIANIFYQSGATIFDAKGTVAFASDAVENTTTGAGMTGWPETPTGGSPTPSLIYTANFTGTAELWQQFGQSGPLVQLTGAGSLVPQAPAPSASTQLASFVGP